MSTESSREELEQARREIDRLDDKLLRVLAERMQVVREVGRIKARREDTPVHDPDRESGLLNRWREHAQQSDLAPQFVEQVLHVVLSQSHRIQASCRPGSDDATASK